MLFKQTNKKSCVQQPNVPPKIMSVEDLERNQIRNHTMHQKTDVNMKPPTPQNIHQRPNVQQPFPQQLAQANKGQPFVVPGFRHPNMMVPPHMNVQGSQMHPNLTRAPPNVPMPMNNFNVCISFKFVNALTFFAVFFCCFPF